MKPKLAFYKAKGDWIDFLKEDGIYHSINSLSEGTK